MPVLAAKRLLSLPGYRTGLARAHRGSVREGQVEGPGENLWQGWFFVCDYRTHVVPSETLWG